MHILSIAEVCDRALRRIGATAIRASGSRKEEVDEARYWLDMVVGHQAAREATWWLVPASATFTLTAGVDTYDLETALGATQAPSGIQSVTMVMLYDVTTGVDIHEVGIVSRREFELRAVPEREPDVDSPWMWDRNGTGVAIAPGPPRLCYVDRSQTPTIQFSPAPDSSRTYGARIVFQAYSTDFTRDPPNDKTYKIRSTWNLWMVTALAAEIANGPVRKLPADEIKDLQNRARNLRIELEAKDQHEAAKVPARVKFNNF